MEGDEFNAPFEPMNVPEKHAGSVTSYCVSPTNGRLEWIQATITKDSLNTGSDVTEDMNDFLLSGDKNPMDVPALIIHKSLGGTGDEFWNVFLQGRSFDRDTYDNDVESTVYYAVQESSEPAIVTIKFIFKNQQVTRPYKLSYQVQLPNGDVIENDVSNV